MLRRSDILIVLTIFLIADSECARMMGLGRGGKLRGRGKIPARYPIILPHQEHQQNVDLGYYQNENGARIVQASHFELDYQLGRKITFFCMAQGYPRPEITWFKDGIELYHHKYFQVHEWALNNDTIKSKMEIDPTTQKDAGYYECQADNQYAIDHRGFRTDYTEMVTY